MLFTDFDEKRAQEDIVPPLFDDVRAACDSAIVDLKNAHGWSDTDFRVVAIHRLRNVIQSVLAIRVFEWVIFPNDNFWNAFFVAVPTAGQMEDHFRELDMMARFAALHGIFSALESDVRQFLLRIDPHACNDGKAAFHSVAKCLIGKAPAANSYADFLEMLRLTRNTIHNNGVHRPNNGKDVVIEYGGRRFNFQVDQPVDFVNWSFVAWAVNEILGLLRTLVTDPALSSQRP